MPLRLLIYRLLREEEQCEGVDKCPESALAECSMCGCEWDKRDISGPAVCCPGCGVRFGRTIVIVNRRCDTCPLLPIERIRNLTPEGKLLGRMLEMEVDVQLGISDFKDVNFEERECLRIIKEERDRRERERMDEQRLDRQMGELQRKQERSFARRW